MPKTPQRPARTASGTRDRKPEVILDIVFEEGLLFIAIRNIGERPALKVSCTFDREFRGHGGTQELSRLPLFQNIEFLPPWREIRTFLDTSAAYFARREPTKFAVAIAYRDPAGRTYKTTIRHDLAIYRELAYITRGVSHDA